MKFYAKLILVILTLALIPLIVTSLLTFNEINSFSANSIDKISELSKTVSTYTVDALITQGKRHIKLRSIDIAKQIEVYIKDHPDMTIKNLQNDSYFQSIAVQPIGNTGYTALTDVDTLICRFHKSPKIVNFNLSLLATKLPGFWGVMSKTKGGKVSEGTYKWSEPDGTLKDKYMYIAIVNATTADGVTLSVAATTYIDEFSQDANELMSSIESSKTVTNEMLKSTTKKLLTRLSITILITILIIVIVGLLFAKSIMGPLRKITIAGLRIADGNLEAPIPDVKSQDELRDLSDTMKLLIGTILYYKKHQYKESTINQAKIEQKPTTDNAQQPDKEQSSDENNTVNDGNGENNIDNDTQKSSSENNAS